jgi:hypothetical protein
LKSGRTRDPVRRVGSKAYSISQAAGNLNIEAGFSGNPGEHHRPGTVLHLAYSRQDLLNLLLGLPDGLSTTTNGYDGVSAGRIAM